MIPIYRVQALAVAAVLCVNLTVLAQQADVKTSDSPSYDRRNLGPQLRVGVGVRSSFLGFEEMLPINATFLLSADIAKWARFEADVTCCSSAFLEWHRYSFGLGAAFPLISSKSSTPKGFQLTIPAMVNVGILAGKIGYGLSDYYDTLNWLMIGPSSGGDATWWVAGSFGVNLSMRVNYLFRAADIDSTYDDDCCDNGGGREDQIGFFETVLALGLAAR